MIFMYQIEQLLKNYLSCNDLKNQNRKLLWWVMEFSGDYFHSNVETIYDVSLP